MDDKDIIEFQVITQEYLLCEKEEANKKKVTEK